MFSFHSFKTKLEFRCKRYDKKLFIVDESYTSCTNCFHIKKLKGEEEYNCESRGMKIDRDVNGVRNILNKNLNLRSG
jgi:transposase